MPWGCRRPRAHQNGLPSGRGSHPLRLRAHALHEDSRGGVIALHEGQTLEERNATIKKARNFRLNVMLYKLRAFTDEQNEETSCSAKHVREASVRSEA